MNLVRGNLEAAVQQLERGSGKGLLVPGESLPRALAELGLIDEYEVVMQPGSRNMVRRSSRHSLGSST